MVNPFQDLDAEPASRPRKYPLSDEPRAVRIVRESGGEWRSIVRAIGWLAFMTWAAAVAFVWLGLGMSESASAGGCFAVLIGFCVARAIDGMTR